LLGIQNVVVWAGGDVVCVDYLYLRVPDDAAKDVAIGLKDPALNRCIPALVSTRTILGVGEKPTATQPATGAVRKTSRKLESFAFTSRPTKYVQLVVGSHPLGIL
jgi:hypothetical protein